MGFMPGRVPTRVLKFEVEGVQFDRLGGGTVEDNEFEKIQGAKDKTTALGFRNRECWRDRDERGFLTFAPVSNVWIRRG